MPLPRAAGRLEPLALAVALACPLAVLALSPGGWPALLRALEVGGPVVAIWLLVRRLRRSRRPPPRPAVGPPPIGPLPPEAWAGPYRVRRRGRVVLSGPWDEVVASARAGRLEPLDEVLGSRDLAVAPADLADLLPFVPSPAEARAGRAYRAYLLATLAAGGAGVALLAWARATGTPVPEDTTLLAVLFGIAALLLLPLRAGARRLAAARAQGLVPEPPPRRTLGSAPLDAALAGPTPATRVVLAVVVAISGLALLLPPDALLLRLAKDDDAIRRGEVWRLVTAGLVHGSVLHLALNAIFLSNLGGFYERLAGPRRMLAVLWGGVLAGSLASFVLNPHPSVGISGGLFAIVGALLAAGLRLRRVLPSPARRMLVRAPVEIIVLNLALGLAVPIVDNTAHVGGLVSGVLLGLALGVRPEIRAALVSPSGPGG